MAPTLPHLVLVFLAGLSLPAPSSRATPTFRIQPDNAFSRGTLYYRTLELSEEKSSLYIGAMNYVFRVWMFNINDTENQAFFVRKELQPEAEELAKCAYRSQNPNFSCQNHVRVLFKLRDDSLYVCSTNAYSPVVTKLDSNTLAVLDSDISGAAVCSVDPSDNDTAVYVEDGNPSGIGSVYSGTAPDFKRTNRIIYRPQILDPVGHQVLHPFMRTMHTDSKWLNEPQFVGSFEKGSYVYFFFRETAVEFSNCGKAVFSRVARICKSDLGGEYVLKQNWATFLKARLNCSLSGELPFYFDQIQSIYRLEGEDGETTVYGTFTTALNGFYGSAVCAFNLRHIDNLFDSGVFKEQLSSSSAWLPVLPAQIPAQRPGQCVEDTRQMSDSVLHFIRSHPLMDDAVGSESGGPLFFKRDLVLTSLVVDSVKSGREENRVIFAGADGGELYKILQLPQGGRASLLAVYRLPTAEEIRTMKILRGEFVYTAQDSAVSQLSVSQCHRYLSCGPCVSDPYCAWNNPKQQCKRAQESQKFKAGWVVFDSEGGRRECEMRPRRDSKVLYPGDSVHLDCPAAERRSEETVGWQVNNRTLTAGTAGSSVLFTVEGGLVLVNISARQSGQYECYRGQQMVASYQIFIDEANCQKPHNLKAFQAVYREWCREFQEYKTVMLKWKSWYEKNTQCSLPELDMKRLPAMESLDPFKKTNKVDRQR